MIFFEKLKLILWDFDDTLCFHTDHSSPADEFDTEYHMNVLLGRDVYKSCSMNKQIKEFMQLAKDNRIRQGLISGTDCYIHAVDKHSWVKSMYSIDLENYCVGSQKAKLGMLVALANAYGLRDDEILLVDDVWDNLERAADRGFQSCTPVEIINFVNEREAMLSNNFSWQLGKRIYDYALNTYKTLGDFAEQLGYSVYDTRRILNGEVLLSPIAIDQIVNILGITKEELFAGFDE